MKGIRFSLAGLLAFVAFMAGAFTALRYPTWWMEVIVFTITLIVVAGAILAACLRRGKSRAFWLGFALFGSLWLIAADVPDVYRRLITSLLTKLIIDRLTISLNILNQTAVEHARFYNPDGSLKPNVYRDPAETAGGIILLRGPGQSFMQIADCLWSLTIGFLGGVFARFISDSREGGPASKTASS